MGLIIWFLPLTLVFLSRVISNRNTLHLISASISGLMLLAAGFITNAVINNGVLNYNVFGGLFYVDSVSAIVLDIVILIGLLASIYSIGYLEHELAEGKITPKKIKLYYTFMYSFMFAMILALTVNNMGILWIAIEATTLASTFLVGFYGDKHAVEAAWKYVIICSVGIAIALMGIIFLHLSSVDVIEIASALNWHALLENARDLDTPILRLSFIFIVIGFGTKAGLAPMHTWLPDAHSQAPSPISALLSGVLLNSAMYAILRTLSIVNKNLMDNAFAGRIMVGFGLLSVLTAAIFILTQKDYKRLLAYSSIEHMGIIAIAMGLFTPLSVFAGLFHMINHSMTKSMLFMASGSILQKYGTREISKIKGLLTTLPLTGTVFLLGLFAISGTPPFSVFASELSVLTSVFKAGSPWLGAALIVLLALIFAGIAVTLFKIFYQQSKDLPQKDFAAKLEHNEQKLMSEVMRGETKITDVMRGETNKSGAVVLILLLVLITLMGLYMPVGLSDLIVNAQKIIIGS